MAIPVIPPALLWSILPMIGLSTASSGYKTYLGHKAGSRGLGLKEKELELMMKKAGNERSSNKRMYEAMMKMGTEQQNQLLDLRKMETEEGRENMVLQYMMQSPERKMQMMAMMASMLQQVNQRQPSAPARYMPPMGMSGLMQLG